MNKLLLTLILIVWGTFAFANTFTEVTLDTQIWRIEMVEYVYDPVTNQTTFTYKVNEQTTDSSEQSANYNRLYLKDLSHFVIEFIEDFQVLDVYLSGCGSYPAQLPSNITEVLNKPDPTTGVIGIKWDGGQQLLSETGSDYQGVCYSFVLPGEYEIGEVTYSVKAGTWYALGTVTGPIGHKEPENPFVQTYSISGTVFVDALNNWILDPNEPLLNSVVIGLFDELGNLITTTNTDLNGRYEFIELNPGSYTVSIIDDPLTENLNSLLLNQFLWNSLTTSIQLIDADSVENNFGFVPNVTSLLDDLNPADPDADGFTFAGDGLTIGFWKHQNKVAFSGKGRAQISSGDIQLYIDQIENYYLSEPFQFDDANEFIHAHDILSERSSEAVILLNKQLLGTEFNEFSGKGLTGIYDELQTILIQWGEFLSANSTLYSREQLLQAKDIFDLINNTSHN